MIEGRHSISSVCIAEMIISFPRRAVFPSLRGNWRDSWIFMLYLGLIPFNTTYRTYLRIKNCEKNGGSRDLFYCYWPWREGTLAFSLASVGAQIRLFYAKRKIKSGFKLWNRLEYTLRSISWRNEAFTIWFQVKWYQYTEHNLFCISSSQWSFHC